MPFYVLHDDTLFDAERHRSQRGTRPFEAAGYTQRPPSSARRALSCRVRLNFSLRKLVDPH
jgi:hypothetical protein